MGLVTETRSAFLACASVAVQLLERPELAATWALPSVHDGLRVHDVATALVRGLRLSGLDLGWGPSVPPVLRPTAESTAREARLLVERFEQHALDGATAGSVDVATVAAVDGIGRRDVSASRLAALAADLEDLALSVGQHVDVSPTTARAALELLVASARGATGGVAALDGLSSTLRSAPAVVRA